MTKHPEKKYRSEDPKPFADRPEEEREAILDFYKTAHPSNYPADRDLARWRFTWQKCYETGTYRWTAGVMLGVLAFGTSGVSFHKTVY